MDWFEPVLAYCERNGPGFWAEPLNAVSNVAFLVAAASALRSTRGDRAAKSLAALAAIVGIGSFLFHTVAQRWSMLADVLPIAVFIYAYFYLAMRRFVGLAVGAASVATLGFAAFGFGLAPALGAATGSDVTTLTNGSVDYVPAILALVGVAMVCRSRADARSRYTGIWLALITGLFAISLALRTLDGAACSNLPSGTHFLWHLLNACVLYGLIRIAAARSTGPG